MDNFKKHVLSFNKILKQANLFIRTRTHGNMEPGYMTISLMTISPKVRVASYIKVFLDFDEMSILLDTGRTYTHFTSQGLGSKLRAIIIWSAKKAGFLKAEQTSTNLNKKNPGKRPVSVYIMNKLGFKINRTFPNFSENRSLNLSGNTRQLNTFINTIKRSLSKHKSS